MVKELAHKKAEKEQDKIIREMLKARKHLRDEVKAVVEESNAKERDAEFQDFHKRHDMRLAEINVSSDGTAYLKLQMCLFCSSSYVG